MYHVAYVNRELDQLNADAAEAAASTGIPRELAADPAKAWDEVLAEIAKARVVDRFD